MQKLFVYLQPLLRNQPRNVPNSVKLYCGYGNYAVLSHPWDLLLVINTNLAPILHRFRDIAFDRSKIAVFGYPLVFNSPNGEVLRKILFGCQWMANVPNGVETLPKILVA